MDKLVILGASGHGREVADVVHARRQTDSAWALPLSFLDDAAELHGRRINDAVVLGGLGTEIDEAGALLGVGYPEVKLRVLNTLDAERYAWPALVHPHALIGSRVVLGRGTFVQAGCVLSCDIQIDEFATLNIGVTISHDVRLGRLSTCSPGAHLGGRVELGEGSFVGIGASVRQGIRIGAWSTIGAGAVVVRDVPPNTVVVGVPARIIDERKDGWQRNA